jgi:hypothetical protein
LVPELVAVALPPPSVNDAKPTAVPELVVVAFWLVPVALFSSTVVAFPVLVQVLSVAVTVQANCAAAGEFARSVAEHRSAALQNAPRVTANLFDSKAGKMCLRMNPLPPKVVPERSQQIK